jgi:DNA-binding NtrC family response regulator
MDSRIESAAGEKPGISELHLEELERMALGSGDAPAMSLREWVALAEAWRIARALREARGNRSAAARALGIGRRTLYSKMEKLSLVPTWGVSLNGTQRPAASESD